MDHSDSPPDAGTTPDTRSLTDLYREVGHTSDPDSFNVFHRRLAEVADMHTQATIRAHAQVEQPGVAWDEQAAVFTTGRFADEGRTR